MAKAKTLSTMQVILSLLGVAAISAILTLMLIVPHSDTEHQGVKSLLQAPLNFALNHPQKHIDALAMQLGEMQARLMQLDAQSERLSKLAGVKEKQKITNERPGAGGPQIQAHAFTESELKNEISRVMSQIELKSDHLSLIETKLIQQSMQKNMLPDYNPAQGAYNSSSYGWRVDPFTGNNAFHEGLDFTAATGTPIYAAAGGVVSAAEHTHDYGKIVKINHGSGIETRYAHASKLLVKAGEVVKKGQLIALVGSTGRSTGAHLHFEVRRDGAALDPRKFLQN